MNIDASEGKIVASWENQVKEIQGLLEKAKGNKVQEKKLQNQMDEAQRGLKEELLQLNKKIKRVYKTLSDTTMEYEQKHTGKWIERKEEEEEMNHWKGNLPKGSTANLQSISGEAFRGKGNSPKDNKKEKALIRKDGKTFLMKIR
jgi:hypothetical protein